MNRAGRARAITFMEMPSPGWVKPKSSATSTWSTWWPPPTPLDQTRHEFKIDMHGACPKSPITSDPENRAARPSDGSTEYCRLSRVLRPGADPGAGQVRGGMLILMWGGARCARAARTPHARRHVCVCVCAHGNWIRENAACVCVCKRTDAQKQAGDRIVFIYY